MEITAENIVKFIHSYYNDTAAEFEKKFPEWCKMLDAEEMWRKNNNSIFRSFCFSDFVGMLVEKKYGYGNDGGASSTIMSPIRAHM
jgi:hypothetical protein